MKSWIPVFGIILAALSALSLPALAAGPEGGKVYGRIFLTLDRVEQEADTSANDFDEWQLNSRSSRFGLKGESEINAGLTVIYQMEFGVDVDGESSNFSRRNSYLGLRSDVYGTILAGKHDTPTKMIQSGIDQFGDGLPGDRKHVLEGDNRMNDVVLYSSPVLINAFTVSVALIPGEDEADGVRDDGVHGNSLADGKSISIEYAPSDSVMLALSVDRDINGLNLERLAAKFNFGKFQLGTIFEHYRDDLETVEMRAGLASVRYTADRHVFKLQGGVADSRIDDGERETYSLGYDYALADGARFVSYLTLNKDQNAIGAEMKETALGVGLEYRF